LYKYNNSTGFLIIKNDLGTIDLTKENRYIMYAMCSTRKLTVNAKNINFLICAQIFQVMITGNNMKVSVLPLILFVPERFLQVLYFIALAVCLLQMKIHYCIYESNIPC
jgi:hypothetical protein